MGVRFRPLFLYPKKTFFFHCDESNANLKVRIRTTGPYCEPFGQKDQHASRQVWAGFGFSVKENTDKHKETKGNAGTHNEKKADTEREGETEGPRETKKDTGKKWRNRSAEKDKERHCETKEDKWSQWESEVKKRRELSQSGTELWRFIACYYTCSTSVEDYLPLASRFALELIFSKRKYYQSRWYFGPSNRYPNHLKAWMPMITSARLSLPIVAQAG